MKQTYALQAITTKYFGATNYRASRIVAIAANGMRYSAPFEHALDAFGNHQAAALALAANLGWSSDWIGGATKDGYVFVQAPK
jgi:hypothetical protein